ncbi:MAG: hypothetical protein C5B59_11670 [Bacteroidetes bacterium]|nr:MAG: hypothetical protein C5B59_11670 [Bacteroidota bacterium]
MRKTNSFVTMRSKEANKRQKIRSKELKKGIKMYSFFKLKHFPHLNLSSAIKIKEKILLDLQVYKCFLLPSVVFTK